MRERIRPLLENLASFLAPGLLLVLLAIQVAFGLHGFDAPSQSLFVVLQVPGVLLGWGGVVVLLPLLIWMILDWWGYDLGGFALRGLGSAVLGVAAGALFGVAGASNAGGIVGGGLADILLQTVGTAVAVIVLVLMAIPAGVLAFSVQKAAPRPSRGTAKDSHAPKEGHAPETGDDSTSKEGRTRFGIFAHLGGVFRRKPARVEQKWYPQQRFDAVGNEMPMEFGASRDVGGIRFADGEPEVGEADPEVGGEPEVGGDPETSGEAEAGATEHEQAEDTSAAGDAPDPTASDPTAPDPTAEEPTTVADLLANEERLPTIPELLAGNFSASPTGLTDDPSGGPRELAGDAVESEPVHVATATDDAPFIAVAAAPAPDALLPGVRYADDAQATEVGVEDQATDGGAASEYEDPTETRDPDAGSPAEPDAEAETTPEDLGLSQAVQAAVRGPAANAVRESPSTRRTMRETVRKSVEAIKADRSTAEGGTKSRYLQKLEALGMFDFALPLDEPGDATTGEASATDEPSKAKRAAKKKAAKKKAAKKRVTKKKAAAKKRPAAKKRASEKKASEKKASEKKASEKKASEKKASKKKAATKKRPAATSRPAARTSTATAAPKTRPATRTAKKKAATRNATKQASRPRRSPPQAAARERAAMLEALRIERLDPLYTKAVAAALERGSASAVLLTRRLGLPFTRARALVDRMIATGVLGEAGLSGSNPVLITRAEWNSISD